ncbi:SCO family protein [Jiella sonneratiae]|uniref:SCO family protein n=1 Tax=Jiella sonneratiae TaxID=2816856 RepID=A0ABS3IXY1_9HYPH|nr:SCO family protein [Jiella sonneratiae]MBO0902251.1 SCO family protein [Jiella sonneratiae]
MQTRTIIQTGLWALVALLAGALVVTYLNLSGGGSAAEKPYGTPFTLVDQNGDEFSSKKLAGEPFALFFGYTHCPDVCPTTLYELASHLNEIEKAGHDFKIVFVTVDPARDTPAVLKDYVEAVSPKIVALTGDEADIAKTAKGWGAFYRKAGEGDDYLMDHTATTFLIDKNGRLAGTIAYGEDPKTVGAKLERLAGA